ncbi:MAG: adenylate/guanylate cyclase domain-containing protein [Candidatus Riflebacteria bacterium]|nr:adenylate/guanylate cyclase domain-containing protein [Candidatus Riflebacteria bacterium]
MKDNFAKLKENIVTDIFLISALIILLLGIFDVWNLVFSGELSFAWRTLIAAVVLLIAGLKIDDKFPFWAMALSVPNLGLIFLVAMSRGIIGQFFSGVWSQTLAVVFVSLYHARLSCSFISEVEFARLKHELKDEKENGVARLLNFSLIGCMKDRQRVVSQAYHVLKELFRVDKAVVFLADYAKNQLVPFSGAGFLSEKGIEPMMVQSDFWDKHAYDPEKGVMNVISGRSSLPSLRQLIPGASLEAMAVMPLSASGKVIGLVAVVRQKPENRHFLEPELFVTFAYVLASALENCRLHEMRITQLDTANKKSESIEASFSKYVSRAVVKELVNNENLAVLGGKKRNITVMMADLRGFTRLTGVLNIEFLVQLLNGWFEEATELILKSQGTIDKFMGDCIMVIFGAPLSKPDDQLRCVHTAFRLHEAFEKFTGQVRLPHGHVLGLGISITTGEAVVGNFGSSTRMEYTAIGETVNLAARLEKLAQAGETVVDESTFNQLPAGHFDYEMQKNIAVKGIADQTIYKLRAVIRNPDHEHDAIE